MLVQYWASFTFFTNFFHKGHSFFFTKIPLRYWFLFCLLKKTKLIDLMKLSTIFLVLKRSCLRNSWTENFKTQPKVLCYYFQSVIVCRRQIDPHLNKTHSQYIYIHISYFDILKWLTYGFHSYKVCFRNKHRLIAFFLLFLYWHPNS